MVPALRHTHHIHLYYNMVSLAWKGLALERRLGSPAFLLAVCLLTLLSRCASCPGTSSSPSTLYVVLALLGSHLLEDPSLLSQCAIGQEACIF